MADIYDFETRDRPAERSMVLVNILMSILVLGGTVFGTIATNIMMDMQGNIKELKDTMINVQVVNGVTANELTHFHQAMEDCKKFHKSVEEWQHEINKRIIKLEK